MKLKQYDVASPYYLTGTGGLQSKEMVFHVISLNMDISSTVHDITMTFCVPILHTHPEGNMSQNLYFCRSFYFM